MEISVFPRFLRTQTIKLWQFRALPTTCRLKYASLNLTTTLQMSGHLAVSCMNFAPCSTRFLGRIYWVWSLKLCRTAKDRSQTCIQTTWKTWLQSCLSRMRRNDPRYLKFYGCRLWASTCTNSCKVKAAWVKTFTWLRQKVSNLTLLTSSSKKLRASWPLLIAWSSGKSSEIWLHLRILRQQLPQLTSTKH